MLTARILFLLAISNEIEEYKQRGFSFVLTKPFKANDRVKTVLSMSNKA